MHAGNPSPDSGLTDDEQLVDRVVQLVEDARPVEQLSCVPASNSAVNLAIGPRDGDARTDVEFAFDRTEACDIACDIAFDDRGSAARLDVPALMSVLEHAEPPRL